MYTFTNLLFLLVLKFTAGHIQENTQTQEKEILKKIKSKIELNLKIIENLEKKNLSKISLDLQVKTNKKCIEVENKLEESDSKCYSPIELKTYDKTLSILQYIKFPKENEILLAIGSYNLNKSKLQMKMNSNLISRFLIVKLTNKSLQLITPNGQILINNSLNLDRNIIIGDLSLFDEDSSIILVSDKLELFYFTVDLKISLQGHIDELNNPNDLHIEMFFPLMKNIIMNSNSTITFLKQHRLHGNKYIIVSFENGNIFVMNKDLEMKSNIKFKRTINKLLVNNSVLAAISSQELIFLSILGGNSVLLKCSFYYNVVVAEYDTYNNLLFIIDDSLNLIVSNIKLSIAKHNSNECNHIYKLILPEIFMKFRNNIKMELKKNNLYILIGSEYISVIDLSNLNENGLINNEFLIYDTIQNNNRSALTNNYNTISYFLNYSSYNVIIIEIYHNNFIITEIKTKKQNYKKNQIYEEKDGRYFTIDNIIFYISNNFIFKTMNKNLFVIYILVLIVLSIVFINFKKQNKNEETDKYKKSFNKNNDDEKLIKEMMKSIPNLKKNDIESDNENQNEISYMESDADGSIIDHIDDNESINDKYRMNYIDKNTKNK